MIPHAALSIPRILLLALLLVAATAILFALCREAPGGPDGDRDPLSADASLGKVVDREGNGTLKPLNADRWATAEENLPLEAGDWVRTGSRGANAVQLKMRNGATYILGPDTLVELPDAGTLKVDRGEVEISAPESVSVSVKGPGDASLAVTGRKVVRARDGKLAFLDPEPRWLTGYKNNASTEALGSLLANVDGRNVPLTMGYHKVVVDIRDQIARTEIEESFLNQTATVLEGVFYFPLPQDASISGFGMWIGDEYVHGEIVEKERAREIYETILREKRDPGLLEWTGGNIFKARVYPISGEKRIKISYTQVLPKVGTTYRYHYALQSEMLRQHPLKKLQIEVKLNSTEPLAKVECPSHTCRINQTDHSASVEFDQEEVTPTRDFELRVGTHPSARRITLIPHRRADDGYFMLLLGAPGAGEKETRPLLANSKPLNLLIVADTSGSMQGPQRETQIAFVEALLGSLGEKDRFNLVTGDVETRWAFPDFVDNSEANRAGALAFVEKRSPLGWSNLDQTFAEVVKRVPADGHVVYVGDGVPTSGDADPVAFSQRLQKLYAGTGTFHAVAPGSSYESVVLRALAALGGGSVREIGGGTDPAQAAFQLLREITTHSVRNIKIQFHGVAAAAVYPDPLPNLPAGSQQIVLGRYNPTAGDAKGSVTVSGTLDGKPVEYVEDVTLAGAENGNSFIPRLWARHHLDHLLTQGSTPQVKERIIALSEDYQIITPYTSFLVLESEADRERFKVKKQFRMRDGEEFFAAGRENANFDLVRKQMLLAKNYRKRIRQAVLEMLADMGRERTRELMGGPVEDFGIIEKSLAAGVGGTFRDDQRWGSEAKSRRLEDAAEKTKEVDRLESADSEDLPASESENLESRADEPAGDADASELAQRAAESPALEELGKLKDYKENLDRVSSKKSIARRQLQKTAGLRERAGSGFEGLLAGDAPASRRFQPGGPTDFLNALFPALAEPRGKDPEPTWSKEVLDLVRSLNRRARLTGPEQGLHIVVQSEGVDTRDRKRSYGRAEHFLSAETWLQIGGHLAGSDYQTQWMVGEERGALSAAWLLGRTRKKEDGDASGWAEPFAWYFQDAFLANAANHIEMKKLENGSIELVLTQPANPDYGAVLVVDPAKAAVVEVRSYAENELVSTTVYGEFSEVGGAWWPGRITSKGKEGKETSIARIEVQAMTKAEIEAAVAKILERKKDAVLLGKAPEKIADAKQAIQDGKARLEDHWAVLVAHAARQSWDEAKPQLQALAELLKGKPGLTLIRLAILANSRQNEELKGLLTETTAALAATPRDADYSAAWQLFNYSGSLNAGNERMALLDTLKPVCERQQELPEPMLPWDQQRLDALQNLNRPEEFFAGQKALAEKYPFQVNLQTAYAGSLANRGEIDAAIAFLVQAEDKNGPWQDYEIEQLRSTAAYLLFNAYRLDGFVTYVETREQARPGKMSEQVWNMYLSALIMLDREAKAEKLMEEWLVSYRKEKVEPAEVARISAAIRHAMGQGHNMYHNRFDERLSAVLAETALYFADHKKAAQLAGMILQYGSFTGTDEGRAARNTIYGRLKNQLAILPAIKISEFFQWLKPYGFLTDEGEAGWQKILDSVYDRWLGEATAQDKQILSQVILGYGRSELRLKCLRKLLQDAKTPAELAAAAQNLFNGLLAEPWKPELQVELLALLPRISAAPGAPKADERDLALRTAALHLLVDWMTNARADAAVAALPGVNEMPRRKVKEARAQALLDARAQAVATLAEMEKRADLESLRTWLAIDRTYQQVKLKAEAKPLETEILALLATLREAAAKKKPEDLTLRERILAERCVATLSYLAVRALGTPGAPADPAVLAILNEAVKGDGELADWRQGKYVLLVALDRGDDLEASLKEWFGEKREFAKLRWGIALAAILAERGRVAEAVAVYEAIRPLGELGADELRTLSDWYTVLDAKDKAREARILSWQAHNEWETQRWLQMQVNRFQRHGPDVPSEMDAEVPIAFVGLFRKSQYPANYLWTLQSFYAETRDFRLLECVPEAVIGQSAQQIYPFLAQLGSLTGTIQEEATLDRLTKHLESLYAKSTHDVNRRALRLLQFMVERKATEQSHGVGPHAEAALTALKEAFRLSWADGEPEMMAGFLAAQGGLQPATLADEQLRELSTLYGGAPANSWVRLEIGGHFAAAQWSNNRQQDAIQTLGGALGEFRTASQGQLPDSANSLLAAYASYLQAVGDFRAAEKVWLDELAGKPNQQKALWIKQALYNLYYSALAGRAEVSLGKGPELYAAVYRQIVPEMQAYANENHLYNLIGTLCNIWHTCHVDLKYAGIGADVTRFAFDTLPPLLNLYNYRNAQGMISTVAERLHEIVGVQSALEFLIVRAETEPNWLRLQSQGFWNQLGSLASRYRTEAPNLPAPLAARLLTLVLRELREDLRTTSSGNRSMYSIQSSEFWAEKKDDFARTAHEVLAQYEKSEARVIYIAEYFYNDLKLYGDAIDALLAAHRRQLLGLDGQYRLCGYLQAQNRHAESIPILVPMIAQQPDALAYRVLLMTAYFKTGNASLLMETLGQADAYFHKDGRWTEEAMSTLGGACLETQLFKQCIAYYDEAIALHVKTAPNRGVGDGTLSVYYRNEAGAYSGLGQTDKAVDAAAGAILSWGPGNQQRQYELDRLDQVLRAAKDLDAYVGRLDAVVKESGLENPIVRKALGKVYFEQQRWDRAVTQLQLAVDVQPNDVETHRMLIQTFDQQGARDRATAQLLESAKLTGHSVELYKDLGKRYAQLEQPESAERAYTNLVEMMPQESESHQALAEVRHEQSRWSDEALQWRHVIRIRSREPGGYLGLAKSLISANDWPGAREVVEKIIATDWPARFENARNEARELLGQIERGPK